MADFDNVETRPVAAAGTITRADLERAEFEMAHPLDINGNRSRYGWLVAGLEAVAPKPRDLAKMSWQERIFGPFAFPVDAPAVHIEKR